MALREFPAIDAEFTAAAALHQVHDEDVGVHRP